MPAARHTLIHRHCRTVGVVRAAVGVLAAAILGWGVVAPAAADSTSRLDVEAVEAFIADQLDRHQIPGATLAVIDRGEVRHTAAFGDAAAGEAMTPTTAMPIGSVTKTFTAVAVLQLVEDGNLALDAPVRDYLPWFTVDHATASAEITVRHLLQHTSGLSERGYNRVLAEDTTILEAVQDLQRARPTAEVGTTHQYFNPNYTVLALLIETVSGSTYDTYLAENIISPLRMSGTDAADPDTVAGTVAQGHLKLFGYPLPLDPPYDQWRQGADGVVSTAPDLARLAIALSDTGSFGGKRVLSADSVAEMWNSHGVGGAAYGLGWQAGEHRGERVGGHGGADPAYSAELAVIPDRGRGYTLLMNSDHLLDLMVALPQIRTGMLDLLQDRTPTGGGLTMNAIGIALLLLTLLIAALAVRSAYRLRGWTTRAHTLSTRQLVGAVAPKFLVPVAVWVALYQLSPLLITDRAFNLRYVGAYYAPDLVILLLLATIPDVLLGIYMLTTALPRRQTPPATEQHPHADPTPTTPSHVGA